MAFKTKFEIGEKVKIISSGCIGTIQEYSPKTDYSAAYYKVEISGHIYNIGLDNLKKATSSDVKLSFPLEVGQKVTLLDGKEYIIATGGCCKCAFYGQSADKCALTHIQGRTSCSDVIGATGMDNGKCFQLVDSNLSKSTVSLAPGMYVKIRPDLQTNNRKYSRVVSSMLKYANTWHKVKSISSNKIVLFDNYWDWLPEDFSEVSKVSPESENNSNETKPRFTVKDLKVGGYLQIDPNLSVHDSITSGMLDYAGKWYRIRNISFDNWNGVYLEGTPPYCWPISAFSNYSEECPYVESDIPIKSEEILNFSKHKFTLTEFEPEYIGKSKRTIL